MQPQERLGSKTMLSQITALVERAQPPGRSGDSGIEASRKGADFKAYVTKAIGGVSLGFS